MGTSLDKKLMSLSITKSDWDEVYPIKIEYAWFQAIKEVYFGSKRVRPLVDSGAIKR